MHTQDQAQGHGAMSGKLAAWCQACLCQIRVLLLYYMTAAAAAAAADLFGLMTRGVGS